MSGMYNMIFGRHALADILMGMLAAAESGTSFTIGRHRDAWLELDEKGEPRITVYTRNGGPNREHITRSGNPAGPEHTCLGCIMTHVIPLHPNYLGDKDDEFDATYARIFYSVPLADGAREHFIEKAREHGFVYDKPLDTDARWKESIHNLNNNPEYADRLAEKMRPGLDKLVQAIQDPNNAGGVLVVDQNGIQMEAEFRRDE